MGVDIYEMINMLREDPSRECVPSGLTGMLASRACRSSVMIGDVLDDKSMSRIVQNMSTLDNPWCCPHGR